MDHAANVYHKAINLSTGEVIADKVKIAQDFKSRSIGLLNRTSMGEEEGLLIKPCNSIHTFFMKFPIDVLFLDKNGKIVKLKTSMRPWRLADCLLKAFMTLELSPGKIIKTKLKPGDLIRID